MSTTQLIDTKGVRRDVEDTDLAGALQAGWRLPTDADDSRLSSETAQDVDYGGIRGGIGAVGAGFARGLTLGGTDIAARLFGDEDTVRTLQGLRQENPGLSTGGEFVGALAPALVGAGAGSVGRVLARTPAGAVARIGEAGFAGGLADVAIGSGIEGAAQSAGSYLSDVALTDRELSAEGLGGALGLGFGFGAAGGAAALGIQKGAISARRLLSKSETTEQAAQLAEADWTRAAADARETYDSAAEVARREVARARSAAQTAAGAEPTPGQMADALSGVPPTAPQQAEKLEPLLREYDDARAALDLTEREIDDLERSLTGMRAPEVQVGGPVGYRRPPWSLDETPGMAAPTPASDTQLGLLAQGTPVGRASASTEAATAVGRRPGVVAEGMPEPVSLGRMVEPATGVPVMITQKMRGQLSDLGYTAGEVSEMTPARAWEAIQAGPRAGQDATAVGRRPTLPASANAGSSLEDLLAGTKSRLDAGESLSEIGAVSPLRRSYVTGKELDTGRPLTQIPDHGTIKAHEAKADDYLEQTVSASELAKRGYYEPPGAHGDAVRSANAAKAIKEGQREPIQLNVSPSGKITVTGGRHRLKAAIDADAPIKVQWSTGAEPAADDVLRGGSAAGTEFSVDHKFLGSTPMRLTSETRNVGGNKITEVKVFRQSESGEPMFVGEARFTHQGGKLLPDEVTVDGPFQRLGIGTRMYKAAEDGTGLKVMPGKQQTEAGKAFSAKYRGSGSFTKTQRHAGGSQGGAWYRDGSGQEWFGKSMGGDAERVHSEHLANQIYREMGVAVPETKVVEISGTPTLMSKEIKGGHPSNVDALSRTDAKDGFVVDAWLNNRDVLGMNLDNLIIDEAGKVHRIDVGGTFNRKATGGDKTFVGKVGEIDSMRDPKRGSGRLFSNITPTELKVQLDNFVKTYEQKIPSIERAILESGLEDGSKKKLLATLKDRAAWIKEQATKLTLAAPPVAAAATQGADTIAALAPVVDKMNLRELKATLKSLKDNGYLDVKEAVGLTMRIQDRIDEIVDELIKSPKGLKAVGLEMPGIVPVSKPSAQPAVAIPYSVKTPSGAPRTIANEDEFQRLKEVFRSNLTPDEIAKSLSYSRDYYMDINNTLRKTKSSLTGKEKEILPVLDQVMKKAKIDGPLITHRGVHFDPSDPAFNLRPGEVLEDPAFMSTSWRDNNIRTFGNVHFVIESPTGTRIAPIPSNFREGELLIDRGSKLRILSREELDDGLIRYRARVEQSPGAGDAIAPHAMDAPAELPAETGLESIARMMREASSDAAPAAPVAATAPTQDDDLTELLVGTKRALDSGQSLRGIAGGELPAETGIEGLARVQRAAGLEDITRMADAVTRMEKASAELVEALGPAAPPRAVEATKVFRKAESEADRRMSERAVRALDDHVEPPPTTKRRKSPDATTVDQAPTGMIEGALVAGRRRDEAAAMSALRGLEGASPAPVATVGGTAPVGRLASMAADAGAALEVADAVGIPGLPRPGDVPVIGPLLSVYLKYRAIKRAWNWRSGRGPDRIAATGNARAAAMVAKVKDRVVDAVDRSLAAAAAAAPKTRAVAAVSGGKLGEALAQRAFDDGEPDAPPDASTQAKAAVRIRELAAAVADPTLISRKVRQELRDVSDPDLIAAAEANRQALYQHLNDKAPKAPPPNPYSRREWEPPLASAMQLARRLQVANDPTVALDALATQTLTPEAAETFRIAYPKLAAFAQARLMEQAERIDRPVPYRQRLQNSLLFQIPLDDSMQPEHAAVLATAHAPMPPAQPQQPAAPPAPGLAAPTNITQLYQTTSDRRAMR